MRTFLCVLCVAMCSGIASAQEHYGSNFDACVSEARHLHTDSVTETYFSYKCDGAIAQRLAARPDQCVADVRPSRDRIERTWRQMEDGLYKRMIWRTDVCAGMCETRFYSDGRATSYLCEVRRHIVGVSDGPTRYPGSRYLGYRYSGYRYPGYRRYVDEYVPDGSVYRSVRRYQRTDVYERRVDPEPYRRPIGRWVYRDLGRWYFEEYGYDP